MSEMKETKVVEIAKIPSKKRVVVTGFAGAGFISNTALMSVVNSVKFKQVAYLRGDVPPLMVLLEGKPKHCLRIYTDPSDELMFIVTEASITGESAWSIAEAIGEWLMGKGVSEIIALEGFPAGYSDTSLFGFTTGKRVLTKHKINPVSQGAISGLNATMLDQALQHDIPWTNVYISTAIATGIDYTGVIAAINLINELFNFRVDTTSLQKLSDDIQSRLAKDGTKKSGLFRD